MWEWVQDGWDPKFYAQFQENIAINQSSPFSAGSQGMRRGGDWSGDPFFSHSSLRFSANPEGRSGQLGFRVMLVVGTVPATVPEPQPASTPDRAVSFVESLSGKVIRDDNSPGKPVTRIELDDTKVTDAGLKELAPFTNLRDLYTPRG